MPPRSASTAAGSRRSPENPAPAPMRSISRMLVAVSVALQVMDFGEEEILPRRRPGLDAADLVHELRRLPDLLRHERKGVIRGADHRVDLVDRVFGVLRLLEINLGGCALVLVDGVDRFLQ